MSLVFYPQQDNLESSSLEEKLEVIMDAAERYKAAILDISKGAGSVTSKPLIPKDISVAFNWEVVAKVLTEIRQLPEGTSSLKLVKADKLAKLAEIYEVLRAAKMPKLEAVRIALMNEASQLRGAG